MTHSSVSGGETSSITTEERESAPTSMTNATTRTIPKEMKPVVSGQKLQRLVDWNTDILLRLLRNVVTQRQLEGANPDAPKQLASAEKSIQKPGSKVFDEIADIIALPAYDSSAAERKQESEPAEIDQTVINQLHEYVSCIADLYRDNSFHSFDHASHVTMSVNKLLKRITAPGQDTTNQGASKTLHDNTYGIASDPLTQFAVVLSALIHDGKCASPCWVKHAFICCGLTELSLFSQ